MKRARKNLA